MTKQSTNTPQQSLRALIADDAFVARFQTIGQHRAALLRHEATCPASRAETTDQVTTGAAVKCESGELLGRNVTIDVHDATERACNAAHAAQVDGTQGEDA